MSSISGKVTSFQPCYLSGPSKVIHAPVFAGTPPEKTEKPFASALPHEPSQKGEQVHASSQTQGRPGIFGDKVRLATGFILEDVVPPLLGFAFLAGPLGWLITLGSLPLSYASGKLGRRIASGVKPDNLPPAMKSFQDFREGFRNRESLKGQYDLLDKWNVFIDDALNVRSGFAKMIGGLVGSYLKVSKDSKMGQLLSSQRFLKANICHDVAQASSVGGAIKAGANAGLGFWFYNGFLPGAGLALEKGSDMMWGPLKLPFQSLGWILKNLPLLKLGKDMLSTPKSG
jgi:hypothetical protein